MSQEVTGPGTRTNTNYNHSPPTQPKYAFGGPEIDTQNRVEVLGPGSRVQKEKKTKQRPADLPKTKYAFADPNESKKSKSCGCWESFCKFLSPKTRIAPDPTAGSNT